MNHGNCPVCGVILTYSVTYEWANLTESYADITDYLQPCRSHHRRFDAARRANEGVLQLLAPALMRKECERLVPQGGHAALWQLMVKEK